MKTCIAVPIKTINRRLPGKTFKLLNGKPLYSYLFNTLREVNTSGDVGQVFVYSSDEKVLDITRKWNFTPLKQPPEYDTNPNVTGDFLIEKIIDDVKEYDLIGWLHLTSPFLTGETIKRSISFMNQNPGIDSLFGVVPRYNRFWHKGQPINHDPEKLLRTQDLVPVQEEADFYFFRRDSFETYRKRVCGNFYALEVKPVEAVDIDNLQDLVYAESLLKSRLVKR